MDIPRKSQARKRLIKRIVYGVIVLGGVAGLSTALQLAARSQRVTLLEKGELASGSIPSSRMREPASAGRAAGVPDGVKR